MKKKITIFLIALCLFSTFGMFVGSAKLSETLKVTGNISADPPEYVVTWKDFDDTELEVDRNVKYGSTPSYDGNTPTRPATAQYTYTFAGWSKDGSTIEDLTKEVVWGNTEYVAQYTFVVNGYTVTWKNYDGTVLETDTDVPYGTIPVYDGATPVRAKTAKYTYKFKSWDKTISAVTGDITYTATFTSTVNKYNITWTNADGNILRIDSVEYDQTPAYNSTPTKDNKNYYYYTSFNGSAPQQAVGLTYTFKGWSTTNGGTVASPAKVTGNATYYAIYTESKKSATLTVNRINTETGATFETVTKTYYIGANYSYSPGNATIDGVTYFTSQSSIKGVLTRNETVNVYYAQGSSTWNGTTVSSSLSGAGTQSNPYLITSAADLAYLRDRVNSGNNCNGEYYKQTRLVDLTNGANFMIGNSWTKSFDGTYDGNNCRIKGLAISQSSKHVGLFSLIGENGTVKNVIVEGTSHSTFVNTGTNALDNGMVGGIAGYCAGQMINCISYVNITNPTCDYAGGVVGMTGENSLIDNCKNFGTIDRMGTAGDGSDAQSDVGGVVGIVSGIIRNCSNYGAISGATSVGGILGGAYHNCPLIYNCINYGNITGTKWNAGGIVGLSNAVSTQYCVNYGTITIENGSAVGGIAGTDTGNIISGENKINATISYCINNGTINAKTTVGGIVGTSPSQILNSINCGAINSKSDNTGGIVGKAVLGDSYISQGVTLDGIIIENCSNYGTINAGWAAGGIVGFSHIDINNCMNKGQVISSSTHIGGIVGDTNSNITNCENYGAVSGSWGVGGIAGSASGSLVSGTNNGTINGKGQVGGIVGKQGTYNSDNVVTSECNVTNCTNNGYVIGQSAGSTAGISGHIAGSTYYDNLINTNTNTGVVSSGKEIVGSQLAS